MIRPAVLLALALQALAAGPAPAQSALKGHDTDAPIDITSDRTELQDRENRAIWVGSVHAVQGDMTMDAQRMTVSYSKAQDPNANPVIHRVDASGGVTVVDPSERAKGSFGIYDLDRRLITLIGNVSLTRGTNTVNGARLVIDLDSGRSTVDGNAVGAPAGSAAASGGRVTGHFTVPKRATAATPPPSGATPPK